MTRYQKALGAVTVLGLLATGGTAFAQTASTTTTGSSTVTIPATTNTTSTTNTTTGTTNTTGTASTPTAPNTGAGGDTAMNLGILTASALVAMGGAAYLARKRTLA